MSEMSVTARALRRRLIVFVAVRGLYALLTTGSEVGAKNFRPTADALPGGAGRPNLIIWRIDMVTTFTYKPSLVRIDARNFELWW